MDATKTERVEATTVLVSEAIYGDLPAAVRKLIAGHGTPIPSGDSSVFSFEIASQHWAEIESELAAFERATNSSEARFLVNAHYISDYRCAEDGAEWSLCDCEAVDLSHCPICDRPTQPKVSERYIVIRHKRERKTACEAGTGPVLSAEPL